MWEFYLVELVCFMLHHIISLVEVVRSHMIKFAENISGIQSGVQPSSKPVKSKTTKAERRALQDAQRAAKAAAKGSTSLFPSTITLGH